MSEWDSFPVVGNTAQKQDDSWDSFPSVSSPPVESTPVAEATNSDGFGARVGERLQQRKDQVEAIGEKWENKSISTPEAVLQVVGRGVAGSLLDVLGEGISSGVSWLVPDDIEEPAKEYLKDSLNLLSNTEGGKLGLAAIEKGQDAYEKFKTENPRIADNLESVINIGLVFTPAKAKKTASPSTLGLTAEKLDKRAADQLFSIKKDYVDDLIRPKQTPKVRIDEVSRTKEVGRGPFRRNVVEHSPREKVIAEEVNKVAGVGKHNSIQGNYNLIQERNKKIADALEKNLAKNEVQLQRETVRTRLETVTDDIIENNVTVVGDASLAAKTKLVEKKAIQFLDEEASTPLGVLKARRKFDAWLLDNRKNLFEGAQNTLKAAGTGIRDEMNTIIHESAPAVGVKKSLDTQSALYDAMRNIAPKAADEYSTAIGRTLQNLGKLVPIRNKSIQEAGVLLGMGGLGAASKFAPWFTGMAAATGITYAGGKIVISPSMKKGVAQMIKLTDKAITDSGNSKMRHQLRADRAILVELLKNAEVQEQEEEQ